MVNCCKCNRMIGGETSVEEESAMLWFPDGIVGKCLGEGCLNNDPGG